MHSAMTAVGCRHCLGKPGFVIVQLSQQSSQRWLLQQVTLNACYASGVSTICTQVTPHACYALGTSTICQEGRQHCCLSACLLQSCVHGPQPNENVLVQECGIGWQSSEDSPGRAGSPDMALGGTGAGHRVLVFAQLKGMLDLVEADVLRPGGISFLRLDGRLVLFPSVCCSCAPSHLK